jgi:glycosyltransferase involved in cell wall biosynthesis
MRFFGGFELSEPLRYASNVRVFLQEMPPAHLRRLQNRIGIHVCPSKLEGFGHSLNEARAASGILVTTDGPPMNEFVTHGENGFLVPVHASDVSAVGRSLQFNITSDRLAEQIDQLLSLPDSRRRAMGGLSRQKYLSDRDRFYTNLSRWRDSVRAQ